MIKVSHTGKSFKATEETLPLLNADLTKTLNSVYPTVVIALNDGATYTNNFLR